MSETGQQLTGRVIIVSVGWLKRTQKMTRFYFDIHDGEQQYRDDDGADLPDLSTAEAGALQVALELAREHLRTAKELKTTVQVRDDSEKPLVRVSVAAKVTVEPLK